MGTKVAINGFGRIGRNVLRAALEGNSGLEFVAVNDITDSKTLAHLLKYDSLYGQAKGEVSYDADSVTIGRTTLKVFAERDPGQIPWGDVGADIVIEGTGLFRQARRRSQASAGFSKEGHYHSSCEGSRRDDLHGGERRRPIIQLNMRSSLTPAVRRTVWLLSQR